MTSSIREQVIQLIIEMRTEERKRKGLNTDDSSLFALDVEPVTEAEAYRVRGVLLARKADAEKASVTQYNESNGLAKRTYRNSLNALEVVFKEGGGRFRQF